MTQEEIIREVTEIYKSSGRDIKRNWFSFKIDIEPKLYFVHKKWIKFRQEIYGKS